MPDAEDRPREACGLMGAYGVDGCAGVLYRGMFALQHRGQEGAGMAVSDGAGLRLHKGEGLVCDVFAGRVLEPLAGDRGIGHVRYSTTGSTRLENVQPLAAECADGACVVAHNGNLVNAAALRRMYQEAGAIFQTGTDSEVLVHLLADPMYRLRPRRVERALGELQGAFALLMMTRDAVMAARDSRGFKPLVIGRLGAGTVFASETCALAQVGAEFVRDVQPGELVTVDAAGLHSSAFGSGGLDRLAQCVFEMVYFARPDSRVFGEPVHLVRLQYGMRLAQEHPAAADIVAAVPDSGNSAALGYARASGIPLDYGFIRNHYVGRTFIMPLADDRAAGADLKLAVLPESVQGKRVVMVDDSIVRGNTARRRIARLRQAGAREVHVRIACPPLRHPCYFGIDFPTRGELAAGSRSVEDVRAFLQADSLGYLSVEGMLAPFRHPSQFCTACFTGDYPCAVDGAAGGKEAMERGWRRGSSAGRREGA